MYYFKMFLKNVFKNPVVFEGIHCGQKTRF